MLSAYTAWERPPLAESLKRQGFPAAAAARSVSLDPGQDTAWFTGAVGQPASWLELATGRPAVPVRTSEYEALAAEAPGDLVFVGEATCPAGELVKTYGWRPAASLLDRPPVVAPCA